jgi:hypothetical protein
VTIARSTATDEERMNRTENQTVERIVMLGSVRTTWPGT